MGTLKRKNADGNWEYIQVSGLDVAQLRDDVANVQTSLTTKANQSDLNTTNASLAQNATDITTIKDKKTFVSYSEYGAPLDGIGDDTPAIQAAHAFANQYGLPVIQRGGTIRLLHQVEVKTDTDLSGCTVVLNDEVNGKQLWELQSDNVLQTFTGITQSELQKGNVVIPSLSSLKNCFVRISSSELFGYRGGDVSRPYYKTESFVHTREGSIIGGGLQNDFTNGTLTVLYKKVAETPITFKGLKIIWNFTTTSGTATVVNSQRNNVTFKDLFLEIGNSASIGNVQDALFKGQIINLNNCVNITFDNINGENITGSYSNQSGYIFSAYHTHQLHVNRLKYLNGWGAIGTDYCKDVVVRDSTISRVDCHIGTGDFLMDNVHFLGSWGATIGWGTGKVTLQNCTTEYIKGIDAGNKNSAVFCRNDYGAIFEGEIIFSNHKVIVRDGTDYFSMVNLTDSYANTQNTMQLQMPRIYCRDLKIDNKYNKRVLGLQITLTNYTNVYLPRVVTFDTVNVYNESDTCFFQPIELSISSSSTLIKSDSKMTINVRNVGNSIYSKYENGFTGTELSTPYTYINNKMLVDITDPTASGIERYVVNISNSQGGVNLKTLHRLNVDNSRITAFSIGDGSASGGNPLALKVTNSDIYPYCNSTGIQLYLVVNNGVLLNNTIYCMKKDGTPVTIQSLVGTDKYLRGNVVNGTTSQSNVDKLYKHLDASFLQPTAL